MAGMSSRFTQLSRWIARVSGRPSTFLAAVAAVLIWGVLGPYFGYSDTWQLVINTATTIVTFLMVFLIQNTQNRDTEAIQLKLDEIIRAMKGAHNTLLDLEEMDEKHLDAIRDSYQALAAHARGGVKAGELPDPPSLERQKPRKQSEPDR